MENHWILKCIFFNAKEQETHLTLINEMEIFWSWLKTHLSRWRVAFSAYSQASSSDNTKRD